MSDKIDGLIEIETRLEWIQFDPSFKTECHLGGEQKLGGP